LINDPAILTGMVLSGAHGIYDVHTNEGVVRCTLRGKLKKAFAQAYSAKPVTKFRQPQHRVNKVVSSTQDSRSQRIEKRDSSEIALPTRLSVGDYVKIRKLDASTGLIEEILPRQSELARRDADSSGHKLVQQTLLANLDQVVIVLATTQPEPHFGFLDRYLAICESAQLTPLICINKVDLPHHSRIEDIDQLHTLLKEHTSLFTGPSGVGKSSLVNALEPGMTLRTDVVSSATGKGRHTTTGSQLYPLSGGGWLADSAGIRALAAWDIPLEDLTWCFVEFRPYLGECIYSDCSHVDEEGCMIIQAVGDQVIDEHRYRSYVRMYTEEER